MSPSRSAVDSEPKTCVYMRGRCFQHVEETDPTEQAAFGVTKQKKEREGGG